jgi:hypothetical protein
MTGLTTNFGFLETHDPQLVRLGRLAERYFPEGPNTSLLKLRQLTLLCSWQPTVRGSGCQPHRLPLKSG